MARRTDLLPEIADLCKEVNHAELAIEVAGLAERLARLAIILALAPTGHAYAWGFSLGWSPAHIDGWLPYATAEAAAACRRGLAQMFSLAA